MGFKCTIPDSPTHVVFFLDNSTGDGDRYFIMCFKCGDEFYIFDTGDALIQYVGDEIIDVYQLKKVLFNELPIN